MVRGVTAKPGPSSGDASLSGGWCGSAGAAARGAAAWWRPLALAAWLRLGGGDGGSKHEAAAQSGAGALKTHSARADELAQRVPLRSWKRWATTYRDDYH